MHTPGPWIIVPNAAGKEVAVYSEPLHQVVEFDGKPYHEGLVALVYGHHDEQHNYSLPDNLRLIAAAPELHSILDELDGSFDQQLYQERSREDFDAPDDREYCVNITAKQLRAINAALLKSSVR